MSNIDSELAPGLVVHLDPQILRTVGGSLTTAKIVDGVDRAIHQPHYFLLLELDDETGLWMAAPLFSKRAPGSRRLGEAQKSGLKSKWIGLESYYSSWQMWKIPAHAIAAASGDDETTAADRRRFAVGQEDRLALIARDRERDREKFRPA